MACKAGDAPDCLTASQVTAARKIYAPLTSPKTGEIVFPGLPPGSELGWGAAAGGPEPFAIPASYFKHVVFENPEWNFRTMDFDREVTRADSTVGPTLNAIDPNLKPFVNRKGKLLLYHGWNDNLITAQNTVNYYERVRDTLGARETESAVRLFMAPGMNHCGGGPGPNTADWLTALERWVEQGQAPNEIIATRSTNGKVDRTRPLCRYPQVARYRGTGSTDEAANFVCSTP
jgi:feruloyl esterase